MKRLGTLFAVVCICSIVLCNCGVTTTKVKTIEAPPVEMVEALQSKPTPRMITNQETNKSYLFLGEDVLSSPFTREVYTIEGFNFTRNDSFSIIFSKNPDTIPFYLNNEGVFYTEEFSVTNPTLPGMLSHVQGTELVEVAEKEQNIASNKIAVLNTDNEIDFEILNLDTNKSVPFKAKSVVFSLKPLKNGFFYSYFDEAKYDRFMEVMEQDKELQEPESMSPLTVLSNINGYVWQNIDYFLGHQLYDAEMQNPVNINPPIDFSIPKLIESIKKKQNLELEEHLYDSEISFTFPATSSASNLLLWVEPNGKTIHSQDVTNVFDSTEAPETNSITLGSPIDKYETYKSPDGSIKWLLEQKSTQNNMAMELTFSSTGIETTSFEFPPYCFTSSYYRTYNEEGNIVLAYWKEDIQQYQLGILNQSTGEMAVSNVILPNSMQNEPGFDFHLFSTSQKLADNPEKSVYWFTIQNPNEPHSSTTKSYHIVRCRYKR